MWLFVLGGAALGGGGREGGDHLPGTFGVPVPLVGGVKSSPIIRGRMLPWKDRVTERERNRGGRRRAGKEEGGG